LKEREPHAAGVGAILVEDAGIVDYRGLCSRLEELLVESGHTVRTGWPVRSLSQVATGQRLESDRDCVDARVVVNCAGLHADRVARLAGERPDLQIIPFRGHYYTLRPESQHLCRHLIYPVPDPRYPFLGVHFTRLVSGGVECGPNAVVAFAREGYRLGDLSVRDLREMVGYRGFRRLLLANWAQGSRELARSVSRRLFVRGLQRLIPEIRPADVEAAPSGVRAQAVLPDGSMADDFIVTERHRSIHVYNAPSPAATAGLEIGRIIAGKARAQLDA
jgi:L-2-hydroxyglutarate oxidase